MQSALHCWQRRLPLQHASTLTLLVRHASLTGAISQGIREAQKLAEGKRQGYGEAAGAFHRPRPAFAEESRAGDDALDDRRAEWHLRQKPVARNHDQDQGLQRPSRLAEARTRASNHYEDGRAWRAEQKSGVRFGPRDPDHETPTRRHEAGTGWRLRALPASAQPLEAPSKPLSPIRDYITEAPRSIPYTAADSEFLYGTYSVEAAIKAKRRILHKLYIYTAEDGGVRSQVEKDLYKLAESAGVKIVKVGGLDWKQKLSSMSSGRAHNGFVLEASPVPLPLIKSLALVKEPGATWIAKYDLATDWDRLPSQTRSTSRYPFLLLLDGVTDPGNIGAILRSAYFFGVDGVILTEYGSSSSSSVILKASAGAAEHVQVFHIRNEVDFIKTSQMNHWHFATAAAPDALDPPRKGDRQRYSRQPKPKATPESILTSSPLVLMLGNEGKGVRPKLSKLSDSIVSIGDATGQHPGLDSLNVSVAAAILMRDFVTPFLGSDLRRVGKSEEEDIF